MNPQHPFLLSRAMALAHDISCASSFSSIADERGKEAGRREKPKAGVRAASREGGGHYSVRYVRATPV